MKKIILATSIAASLTLSSSLVAAKTIEIASTYPKDMPFLGEGLKYFADKLNEITEGKLTADIHGAGELVPALEVLSAVSSGAVDAGYDWVGYWGGSIPSPI